MDEDGLIDVLAMDLDQDGTLETAVIYADRNGDLDQVSPVSESPVSESPGAGDNPVAGVNNAWGDAYNEPLAANSYDASTIDSAGGSWSHHSWITDSYVCGDGDGFIAFTDDDYSWSSDS